MFKSIYLVNNQYIERLECHLLISIQTLILQPQFITQTLILRLGDLQDWTCSSQRTSGTSNELRKPFVKSFVKLTVKSLSISLKVKYNIIYIRMFRALYRYRLEYSGRRERLRKICDLNLSLASINNPVTSQSFKKCIILWSN